MLIIWIFNHTLLLGKLMANIVGGLNYFYRFGERVGYKLSFFTPWHRDVGFTFVFF